MNYDSDDCWQTGIDDECINMDQVLERSSRIIGDVRYGDHMHPLLLADKDSKNDTSKEKNQTASNETEPDLTPYERKYRNFMYFNKGFKGHELARNFTNCGSTSIYWYYFETQTYFVKLHYGDFKDSTFNSTMFLQNTT